jgi:CDP-diacylglycerol---serine O-phosphatidyltransferase
MLNRHRRRIRPRPLLHLVPNMFTILGLGLGMSGLRYGIEGRYELAVTFILLAAIVDALDGRSARLLNITSKLGEQLDSLIDFVNFGVVPALLVYYWSLATTRVIGWPIAIVFAACCGLRLARFNTELEGLEKPRWQAHFFTGIPAPAAAGLALLPMMLFFIGADFARAATLNAIMLVFVAFMMVSRVPTFSLKRVRVPPEYVLPVLVGGGFTLIFLVTNPWLTLTVLGLLYIAMLPVGWMSAKRMRRREEASEPAATREQVLPFEARPPRL